MLNLFSLFNLQEKCFLHAIRKNNCSSSENTSSSSKAELLPEGIIFLIHLFARAILLMKKLKIEETKAT